MASPPSPLSPPCHTCHVRTLLAHDYIRFSFFFVHSLIFSGFGFGALFSLFSSTLSLSALKLHFRVEVAPAARPVSWVGSPFWPWPIKCATQSVWLIVSNYFGDLCVGSHFLCLASSRVEAGAYFNGSQFIANKFVAKKFRARPENFQTFLYASVINLQHMCGRRTQQARRRLEIEIRLGAASLLAAAQLLAESSRADREQAAASKAKTALKFNLCQPPGKWQAQGGCEVRRRGELELLDEKCHFKRQPKIVVFIAA